MKQKVVQNIESSQEFLSELKTRIEKRAFQFTFYLSFSAIFLWSIWIFVDKELLHGDFALFMITRISLSASAIIVTLLMYFKKINYINAQYLLYVPALSFLGFGFCVVPLENLQFYMISGTLMVVLTGFVFFIMPAKRAVFFSVYAVVILAVFQFLISEHSYKTLFQNGLILYVSMLVFTAAFAIVRFKSLKNSLKNELLVAYSNEILTRQQEILENKNKELEQNIIEKETLLKEIHHRVKNNLQIISSLLNLQNVSKNSLEEFLKNSQLRIHAMASLHEKLYKSGNLQTIDTVEYIQRISEDLQNAFSSRKIEIRVLVSDQPVFLDMDKLIPLGLIVNELISNSIKHALPEEEDLKIIISVERVSNSCEICIVDNGRGFPQDMQLISSESLGLRLVYGLINQINASIEFINKKDSTQIKIRLDEGC